MNRHRLYYESPSARWLDGMPLGNGRLAAMLWQQEDCDILTLNHEWLWRGVNRGRKPAEAAQHLPEVRELLKKGDFFHATELANVYFAGLGGCSGEPVGNDAYQVAGELSFRHDAGAVFTGRELDMYDAVAQVHRTGVTGQFAVSSADDVFLFRWQGNGFSGDLTFSRTEDAKAATNLTLTETGFVFDCAFDGGIRYRVQAQVTTDGKAAVQDGHIRITDANELFVVCNIGTEIKGIETELAPRDIALDDAFARHSKVFSGWMGRMSLELADDGSELSTEQRFRRAADGVADNLLTEQAFHFGRYLLYSASMGELPANLQGKWNDSIAPIWECDYHMDINLEMNYWFAEACGMTECAQSLVRYVTSFMESGAVAAKNLYGCRGIYLPLQTDVWGISTPESFGWAVNLCAAPWLAQHLWWRYTYTGDKTYLRETAYPYFKAVAQFYEDYLVADDDGVLQIMPSQSPENRFVGSGPLPVSIGISSAMDVQLAYDALGYAYRAAEILDVDADDRKLWQAMQAKLPPFGIGADGRLLEWNEEKEEVEPGHRHFAHLYGLHPSELFTPELRREQFDACKKSLEFRLQHGAAGEGGWINAWVACFYARLGDGAGVQRHLQTILGQFMTDTMIDLYPPDIFQIDGNFGYSTAVLESLVGYSNGRIRILQALPEQWKSGKLTNVKTPGGHTVSIAWQDGKLTQCEVVLGYEKAATLVVGGKTVTIEGNEGETQCIQI